jgi:hypothetical protein
MVTILQNKQHLIADIAQKNDVSYLAIFGSYARNEQTQDSDLDMLVDFDKQKGFFELVGLEEQLSSTFGIKVDLVTKNGLSKRIAPYIQDDLQIIYAKKS